MFGKAQYFKAIDQALLTMKHDELAIIEVYGIEKYGYFKNKAPQNVQQLMKIKANSRLNMHYL